MKILLSLLLILDLVSVCYADRVCLEKATGKLIEYQSGDAPLGTLTQNAVNAGYKATDVTEKYVTVQEWQQIKQDQIDKPAQDAKNKLQQQNNQKKQQLEQKLNLSEQDFQDLKQVIQNSN